MSSNGGSLEHSRRWLATTRRAVSRTAGLLALAGALMPGLASASPGPRLTSLPAPPGQRGHRDGLVSATCADHRACFLLAITDDGVQDAFDRFDGRRVSAASPPLHRGLLSVVALSCPTSRMCIAVGQDRAQGRVVPAAELWNGHTWRVQEVPPGPRTRRSIANSQPRDLLDTRLAAVSCSSERSCVAVGDSSSSGADRAHDLGVIRRWDGSQWRVQRPADPRNDLGAVSCASRTFCVATGGDSAGAFTTPEQTRGSGWVRVRLPPIPGGGVQGLAGVSCPTTARCIGVGGAAVRVRFRGQLTPTRTGLIAEDHSGHWTTQRLPLAPGIKGRFSPGADGLSTISCAPTPQVGCTARGTSSVADSAPLVTIGTVGRILAHLGADGWTQSQSPTPLGDLACPTSALCLAPAARGLDLLHYADG